MFLWKLLAISVGLTLALGSPVSSIESTTNEHHKKHEINQDTLRQVTVVMRHGERAPQDTYPNDPYLNDTMKPYGWGQLTNQGRISQYNQGVFLRQRYDQFLGPAYNPDVFWLQCTAVDRTKMSALLEAAALWEPKEDQLFKSDLAWQPVTLFYQPRDEDTLLLIWSTCPKYAQQRNLILGLSEVLQVQNENKELFDQLTNLTGMLIISPDDVASLHGTLTAEESMNLSLPEWTKDYYPKKLEPLTMYSLQLNTYNDVLKRLKGGPLLKKIITDMNAKMEGTLEPDTRKMFMYIGHDSTITTLLDTMGLWQNQMPVYNIMTMIELHEDENGYNVQIFLKNCTTHDPFPLTLPGCDTICPLHKFIELLKPMIPDDWDEECKAEGDYTPPPAPAP